MNNAIKNQIILCDRLHEERTTAYEAWCKSLARYNSHKLKDYDNVLDYYATYDEKCHQLDVAVTALKAMAKGVQPC